MFRFAVAALALGWLVGTPAFAAEREAEDFVCYPADTVVRDFEAADEAQIWTPRQAQLALEKMPSLLDGWSGYPITGALVFERTAQDMAFVGMLIGQNVCGAKLMPQGEFQGLKAAVFGLDA